MPVSAGRDTSIIAAAIWQWQSSPDFGPGDRRDRIGSLCLIARGFIFESVKLPDIYSDWRIIAGLVLMILGAGNWITGVTKTAQYNNALAAMVKNGSAQVSSSF